MTFKEAALKVFEGKDPGQIVWQPRIENWYDVNKRKGTLPEKYEGMSLLDIYDDLNCSPRPYLYPRPSPENLTDWGMRDRGGYCPQNVPPVIRIKSGKSIKITQQIQNDMLIEIMKTPKGELVRKWHISELSIVPSIVEFPVKKLEDLDIVEYMLLEQEFVFDQNAWNEVEKKIGDRAPLAMNVPRAPLQQLFLFYMGYQNTILALYDQPQRMERFFKVAEEADDKAYELIKKSPVKIVNFPENIDSKFVSPPLLEKYLMPHWQKRTSELKEAGKYTDVHWDGYVKSILRYVPETGFDGFEALTPKPQGDVTVEEIKEALGDRYILLDGIPAVYFLPWESEEKLIETAKKLIDLFAPKIILGISDEIPANGDIERVRLISDLVKDYNSSLKNKSK